MADEARWAMMGVNRSKYRVIADQPSPQRMCIGCRRRNNQGSLLRVAKDAEGRVRLWEGSGRSAYVCPILDCVNTAMTKGRLERALHCQVKQEDREALRKELVCKLR
jgi:predicted RNA-binding protein YlxR (DUF448 family)